MSLISILLLSWNHEEYIEQCINSCLNQSYTKFEIIYVDNCSSDKTYQIATALLKESGIVYKAFKNDEPKSISKNLNFLFSESSGEYVVPLSTDDWLAPDFLEKKIEYLILHKEVGMLSNGGWIYYQNSGRYELVDSSNFKRGKITRNILKEKKVLFYVGCCYKRDIIEKLQGWDENLLLEDGDMFFRISEVSVIDYIDEPIVYYRKTNNSISNNVGFMVKGYEQYYKKYKYIKWFNMRHWLAEKYRSYAEVSLGNGNPNTALKLILKSIQYKPFDYRIYKMLALAFKKFLAALFHWKN